MDKRRAADPRARDQRDVSAALDGERRHRGDDADLLARAAREAPRVVFSGTLHPSDWIPSTKGTVFRYDNPAARREGGIFKAYDRMQDKIVDENMSIQFYIGSPPQNFVHSEPWKQFPWGWKATGFE